MSLIRLIFSIYYMITSRNQILFYLFYFLFIFSGKDYEITISGTSCTVTVLLEELYEKVGVVWLPLVTGGCGL